MVNLPYRPKDGIFGDPVPFFWNGEYHLFYVGSPKKDPISRRWLTKQGVGNNYWGHIVSTDLLHWEELPTALSLGGEGEPDSGTCGTGSIIERSSVFHIFYLGRTFSGSNKRLETICHATSKNLIEWKKNPNNPVLCPDTELYETGDWRDPFVFWNEQEQCYWMLITARNKKGPVDRRGCIALATSPDLEKWNIHPPFWDPGIYYALEVPDVFQWNGNWYLIFSEFSMAPVTRYCMANDLRGPWKFVPVGSFDGSRFYAAKTASDGKRRFLFGWIPTREGETDEGKWQWGGDLGIPRELIRNPDATLSVRCPPEFINAYTESLQLNLNFQLGEWCHENNNVKGKRVDGYAYAIMDQIPNDFLLTAKITVSDRISDFGFLVRANRHLVSGYEIRLVPGENRMSIRKLSGRPRQVIAETLVSINPGHPIDCQVFVRQTSLEVFIGNQVSLACRIYDQDYGLSGLFVEKGEVYFENLRVRSLKD